MSYRLILLRIFSYAFIVALGQLRAHAESSAKTVSLSDAKRLVVEAIKSQYPSASVNDYKNENEANFYLFEVSWDNRNGSMIAGHFAVNSLTGDLWSIEGAVCSQLDGTALVRRQEEIRKRLRLNRSDYDRLHALKPVECD